MRAHFIWLVMIKMLFFTSEQPKRYKLWSCQKVCDALHYLLNNIFIRFGSQLYRQIVCIPMGTNCAPLVADLFWFCYERDFMLSLSDNNKADIIDLWSLTTNYHFIFTIYKTVGFQNRTYFGILMLAFSTWLLVLMVTG